MSIEDRIKNLKPGEALWAGGYDWAWCYVWFKEIPGYDGYMAGSNGTIWSCRRRTRYQGNRGTIAYKSEWYRRIPGCFDKGYRRVKIWPTGSSCGRLVGVHILILVTFFGRPKLGQEACHWDGVRDNNQLRNLRWDTKEGNHEDRIRHGTIRRGHDLNTSKFHDRDILRIRAMHSEGTTIRQLEKFYGVNYTTIYNIIHRKTWTHI